MLQNETQEMVDPVLGVAYLTISLLVIISNSVVVFVIVATKDLHLPTLWNLAYMGVFDFSFGLYFLVIVTPCAFFGRFHLSHPFLVLISIILTFFNGQNGMNIALALLDRYVAICWPLKYTQIITLRRFFAAVVVILLLNTIRTCLIVFPDVDVYYNSIIAMYVSDFNTILNIRSSVFFTVLTFGIIIFCLFKIMLDLYRSRLEVSPSNDKFRARKRLMRFSFTIAVSAIVFLLSYLPVMFITLYNFILGKDRLPTVMTKIALVSLLSNSLWNSIIYATTYQPFKDAFLKLLFRNFYRKRKREEVIQVIKIHDT